MNEMPLHESGRVNVGLRANRIGTAIKHGYVRNRITNSD
jgi:hypothetical protein